MICEPHRDRAASDDEVINGSEAMALPVPRQRGLTMAGSRFIAGRAAMTHAPPGRAPMHRSYYLVSRRMVSCHIHPDR
jgi:hypothetical protein